MEKIVKEDEELFYNFKKENKKQKMLLLYFLLNDIPFNEEDIFEITDKTDVLETTRKYAYVINEDNSSSKIYSEIKNIDAPYIYDKDLYEIMCMDNEIYIYRPKNDNFCINNLDILGRYMYISKKLVCTSKLIHCETILPEEKYGFVEFKEYIINNNFEIDKYKVIYDSDERTFEIDYKKNNEYINLFRVKNVSIENTYQLVLYVILKAKKNDNQETEVFNVEKYIKKIS